MTKSKKTALTQIIVALCFAGAILYSSWILKGSEYGQTMMFVIVFLYIVSSGSLMGLIEKKCKK